MNLFKKIFNFVVLSLVVSLPAGEVQAQSKAKKDCVSCTTEEVAGAPFSGNMSLEQLKAIGHDVASLGYYVKTYCMGFTQISNNYEFKKEILKSMDETPFSVDDFWQYPGCIPRKLGETLSPIVHLAAEVPSDRVKFMKALFNYYKNERKDVSLWHKAINAKSTRGHTLLDYILFLKTNHHVIESEKESLRELISFICDNGGDFAANKNTTCPIKI
jgi:hypothetical protein